ncbi:MAG: helix-turn-helix domain-containing protein [Planctomycetaceae bacterium]
MANNKYMTLDEAAAHLGISTNKLMRLREQGEIRGFADRGSWKFTRDSVEELGRLMEADSSPDIPIISNVAIGSDDADDSDFDIPGFDDEDLVESDDESEAPGVVAAAANAAVNAFADDDDDEIDLAADFFADDDDVDSPMSAVSTGDTDEELLGLGDDSEQDFPMVSSAGADDTAADGDEGELDLEASDSDVQMGFGSDFFAEDDDDVAAELTEEDVALFDPDATLPLSDIEMARQSAAKVTADADDEDGILDMLASDSDVRLAADESSFDSDPDLDASGSDVRLAGDSGMNLHGPDDDDDLTGSSVLDFTEGESDIRDSDSDVQLVTDASDSDVNLVTSADSDSDVAMVDSGTDVEIELSGAAATPIDELDFDMDEEDPSNDSSLLLSGLESADDIELASAMFADTTADLSDDDDDDSDDDFPVMTEESSDSSVMSMLISDDDSDSLNAPAGPDSSELMVGVDSDSDIRLADGAGEDGIDLGVAPDSGNLVAGKDSDSDIRMIDEAAARGMAVAATGDSDSDVQMISIDELADSDINFDSDDSGAMMMGTDSPSDLALADDDDSSDTLVEMDSADDRNQILDVDDESSRVLTGTDADFDIENVLNDSDESAMMLTGVDVESDLQLASDQTDDSAGSSQLVTGLDAGDFAGMVDDEGSSDESSRMLMGFDSDSDVRLSSDPPDETSAESSRMLMGLDSDSDVLPAAGKSATAANSSDDSSGMLVGLDSDSDVRLDVGDSDINLSNDSDDIVLPSLDSDSDVRLAVDESDILRGLDPSDVAIGSPGPNMTPPEESDFLGLMDSDSDVRMINVADDPEADSDSDVVLSVGDDDDLLPELTGGGLDTGATMVMELPEDSDLKLIDSRASNEDDSGISLEMDDGVLTFDADESGISLEADDSGISLESLDSGAFLRDDSGLTLEAADSGISLEAADSGIALFEDDDSGISLDGDNHPTQQMKQVRGSLLDMDNSDTGTMEMDVPAMENDSEFELAGLDDDDDDFGTDTSVLMFDDDDAGGDAFSVASQPAIGTDDLDMEDLGGDDVFEDDLGDEFDDDFEDEEMDGVWDAEDQDDDDDFEAGESHVGGSVVPAGAAVGSWTSDAPWGVGWTAAVSVTAAMTAASAFVGIELVRTMWMMNQPGQPTSGWLSMLGGMFGK